MSTLWVISDILLVTVLAMVFNKSCLKIMAKHSAKMLMEEEFKKTMRKAQVIDVRGKDTSDARHILGARSMPYNMLRTAIGSLRKDQPAYLYDQRKALDIRAANLLHKNSYIDIYILKGGYDGWTGKVKKRDSQQQKELAFVETNSFYIRKLNRDVAFYQSSFSELQ